MSASHPHVEFGIDAGAETVRVSHREQYAIAPSSFDMPFALVEQLYYHMLTVKMMKAGVKPALMTAQALPPETPTPNAQSSGRTLAFPPVAAS